jgi:GH15 family glucan-1,4-alpha-glucosidase
MTRKVLSSVEWATAIGRAFLDHLEAVWREPDEGIWEVRGPRQHSSRAASGSSTI